MANKEKTSPPTTAGNDVEEKQGNGASDQTPAEKEGEAKADIKPKHPFTWERSIEILKVCATVWVALIGTIVTMQFNERQHELNRIEAIAKMLPHLSTKSPAPAQNTELQPDTKAAQAPDRSAMPTADMSRDGAIWAIFRTANNKKMLSDLASLFPEDIYRVITSIASAGGLENDQDALTALEVASEKLATRYSGTRKELAARLYNQAINLKKRRAGDDTPLFVVDITDAEVEAPTADETAQLISSVNSLGELHMTDAEHNKKVNTSHWQAKQLYKQARQLGISSSDKAVQLEVAKADLGLAKLYAREDHAAKAKVFLTEARTLYMMAFKNDAPGLKAAQEELDQVEKGLVDH